ncbi:hypothetical protein [Sphingomonas sp. KR3-1]|uniref:hypothetical protein n=1 Tax=Sphingomonas sp. KR3-1 TaxID=3156611 RepID=UPI0032B52F0B
MRFVPLFALLALSTPVLAQQAAPAPDQAAPAKDGKKDKNDPNRQVCRREGSTGSRLNTPKVCHTLAEWKTIDSNTAAVSRNNDGGRSQ